MFKVISIESEKVLESEVSMIPAPVIEFVNRHYGIDVSGVKVVYEDMVDNAGYYNTNIKNTIHISNSIKGRGLVEEMVIAHELNHLMQFEHNVGLSLNLDIFISEFPEAEFVREILSIHEIDDYQFEQDYGMDYFNIDIVQEEYWNKHVEIDSRLTEALYVYEQAGREGIDTIINHVFRCGLTHVLFKRIEAMPNSMAKVILKNEFTKRQKEAEEEAKANNIPDEEFEALIAELLA